MAVGFKEGLELGAVIEVARAMGNQNRQEVDMTMYQQPNYRYDGSPEAPADFGWAWIKWAVRLLSIVAFKIICFCVGVYAAIRFVGWYF